MRAHAASLAALPTHEFRNLIRLAGARLAVVLRLNALLLLATPCHSSRIPSATLILFSHLFLIPRLLQIQHRVSGAHIRHTDDEHGRELHDYGPRTLGQPVYRRADATPARSHEIEEKGKHWKEVRRMDSWKWNCVSGLRMKEKDCICWNSSVIVQSLELPDFCNRNF